MIKSLDREKIVKLSRKYGGERYVKHFDGFTHLLTMLYAVIQRFGSLREIETSMTAEVRNLPLDKVLEIAGGRVYSGSDAVEIGLADANGGLSERIVLQAENRGESQDENKSDSQVENAASAER